LPQPDPPEAPVLRDASSIMTAFARLVLACLLVIMGSAALASTGIFPPAGSSSDMLLHRDAGIHSRDELRYASASLAEQATEGLSVPAESEGDDAGARAHSARAGSRAHDAAAGHSNSAPSRHIRHPGRGPPAA
jgi:hypothetical protein